MDPPSDAHPTPAAPSRGGPLWALSALRRSAHSGGGSWQAELGGWGAAGLTQRLAPGSWAAPLPAPCPRGVAVRVASSPGLEWALKTLVVAGPLFPTCLQIASQLRLFDPQLKEKPEEESFAEPVWLVQLRRVQKQVKVCGWLSVMGLVQTCGPHPQCEVGTGQLWGCACVRERPHPPGAWSLPRPRLPVRPEVSLSGGRCSVEPGHSLPPALPQHTKLRGGTA